ncbi:MULTISPECIES: hypothetical protein [unclassified Methanoregula]|uniref:hypothetical protein n=1 Tax=unclassified Methanoregula TaxID=2649730 RepID=UPI0025F4D1A4|nr:MULTISPECIES: hypothetical protein [unclassified Methanoregula]
MELKYIVTIMMLLAGITLLCGCTGSPQAPVATPAPVPAATTLPAAAAPVATAAPFRTAASAWTTETPYEGHPYTKTFSFHGSGDYEDFTFSTDRDATWVFDLTYPKQGVFTVVLRDAHGDQLDVLANEGGGGNSRKTVFLKAGNYAFDIQADAPWYIMMTTG